MTAQDSQTLELLSPADTAAALADGATIRWWQTTGFVEVAGPDALTLLDGLCTQAVERIEIGTGALGLFLDAKAKIIAPALLHRTTNTAWTDPRSSAVTEAAPRVLLELVPELTTALREHLTRHRLRAKVTIDPLAVSTIAITGAGAAAITLPELDAGGFWSRVDVLDRPSVVALADAETCSKLVRTLLPDLGIDRADPDALEADRIDAGVAGLHDLLVGRMPAEVGGMLHAVSLDAGCYLGQEPVARLHYRGRSNRTLRRVQLADDLTIDGSDPEVQLALRRIDAALDARPVGRITTWARRPDGTFVALAILRRELEPGEDVVHSASGMLVHVLDPAAPAG